MAQEVCPTWSRVRRATLTMVAIAFNNKSVNGQINAKAPDCPRLNSKIASNVHVTHKNCPKAFATKSVRKARPVSQANAGPIVLLVLSTPAREPKAKIASSRPRVVDSVCRLPRLPSVLFRRVRMDPLSWNGIGRVNRWPKRLPIPTATRWGARPWAIRKITRAMRVA